MTEQVTDPIRVKKTKKTVKLLAWYPIIKQP